MALQLPTQGAARPPQPVAPTPVSELKESGYALKGAEPRDIERLRDVRFDEMQDKLKQYEARKAQDKLTQYQAREADMSAVYDTIVNGDLRALTKSQRLAYYRETCLSLGLNPLTKPLGFYELADKKISLYATKECAAQLAKRDTITVKLERPTFNEAQNLLTVDVRASTPDGRFTDDVAAIGYSAQAKGDAAANAWMKLATKAKRRAILSHAGLGALDEGELETVQGARIVSFAEDDHGRAKPGLAVEGPAANHLSLEAGAGLQSAPAPGPQAGLSEPPKPRRGRPPGAGKAPAEVASAELDAQPLMAMLDVPSPTDADDPGVEEAEVVVEDFPFRFEEPGDRQWLIGEMKRLWPNIEKATAIRIASAYKAASTRTAVRAHLNELASTIKDINAPQ